MATRFIFPALLQLNGLTLTDEGRQPLQEDLDPRTIDVDLASGGIKRFYKFVGHKWTINWENVAISSAQTIDGFGGRNEIYNLGQIQTPMSFTITDALNNVRTYTVWVTSHHEDLVMRRLTTHYYKIELQLQEQGPIS